MDRICVEHVLSASDLGHFTWFIRTVSSLPSGRLFCDSSWVRFLVDSDFLDVDLSGLTLKGHTMSLFPVAFLLVFRNGMSFNRSGRPLASAATQVLCCTRRFFEGRAHCGKFVPPRMDQPSPR